MPELLIKDLDERTYRALQRRAAADGRPLNDWILHRLKLEAAVVGRSVVPRPTREEVRRRAEVADSIRRMTPAPIDGDSTVLCGESRCGR
jgi:plasmid stability protein